MRNLPLLATQDELVKKYGLTRRQLNTLIASGKLAVAGAYFPPKGTAIKLYDTGQARSLVGLETV